MQDQTYAERLADRQRLLAVAEARIKAIDWKDDDGLSLLFFAVDGIKQSIRNLEDIIHTEQARTGS